MIFGSERRVKDEVLKQSRIMQENQLAMQEHQRALREETKEGFRLILDCVKSNSEDSQETLNLAEKYLTAQSNANMFLQLIQTINVLKVKEKVHH